MMRRWRIISLNKYKSFWNTALFRIRTAGTDRDDGGGRGEDGGADLLMWLKPAEDQTAAERRAGRLSVWPRQTALILSRLATHTHIYTHTLSKPAMCICRGVCVSV